MGIERDGQGRGAGRVRPAAEPAEEMPMSPVDPIEIADGHNRATSPGGKVAYVLDRDHHRAAPFIDPAKPPSPTEHP